VRSTPAVRMRCASLSAHTSSIAPHEHADRVLHVSPEGNQTADILVTAADHIGRVVDKHLLHPTTARFLEDEVELGDRQMAASENNVGLCDQIEHLLAIIIDLSVRIQRAERDRIEHFCAVLGKVFAWPDACLMWFSADRVGIHTILAPSLAA
jgi:hypothetical protein